MQAGDEVDSEDEATYRGAAVPLEGEGAGAGGMDAEAPPVPMRQTMVGQVWLVGAAGACHVRKLLGFKVDHRFPLPSHVCV